MKKFKLLPVDSPLVEVECGGVTERSQHIKDTKKNPNFPQPVFRFDVVSTVCEMLLSVPPRILILFKTYEIVFSWRGTTILFNVYIAIELVSWNLPQSPVTCIV